MSDRFKNIPFSWIGKKALQFHEQNIQGKPTEDEIRAEFDRVMVDKKLKDKTVVVSKDYLDGIHAQVIHLQSQVKELEARIAAVKECDLYSWNYKSGHFFKDRDGQWITVSDRNKALEQGDG